uniref:Uncharacterized protein n=1 Tax=Amphimedon queenslandica TaxID=400682 RepID=A0A1X7TS05_AMPQE
MMEVIRETEKVAVLLHVDDRCIKKAWRFDDSRISFYTRDMVEADLIQLYPDIARKGHKLDLWYFDELIGEVKSESDNDLRYALVSFSQATSINASVKYRTLHAKECLKVIPERGNHQEPLVQSTSSSGKEKMPNESKARASSNKRKRTEADYPIDLPSILKRCKKEEELVMTLNLCMLT